MAAQHLVTLNNPSGLHARPASLFTKEAIKFKSQIKVIKEESEYNARSIIGILSMGAVIGDELMIVAEGVDENEAVEALRILVDNNFGE